MNAFSQLERFRLPVSINANGYERYDKPVEISIDFSPRVNEAEFEGSVQADSLRVVEINEQGAICDECVGFQYDPSNDDESAGTLTMLLKGVTPAGATRRFHIYFDTADIPALVTVADNVDDEGQESIRINTQNATYFYHKRGAGFSSLIDPDGADWLGYQPGGGSAGEYRGIPNMGHPEGYCHPGMSVSASRILARGPLKATILSESNDGVMRCRWDIFPRYARLTVLKMRAPYWFLYEGTPGGSAVGELDEARGYCMRSTGVRTPLSERWEAHLPNPEWVYFGAGNTSRVLFLVNHQEEDAIDSYWPMEHNMTVFGFGRELGSVNKFMTSIPACFTIGFAPDGTFENAAAVIESAFQPLDITVGTLAMRSGDL